MITASNSVNGKMLQLIGVTQTYGSGQRSFIALDKINLVLAEGEFAALLGPSGCGKSTLLRIIAGLQPPTQGQVLYEGEEVRGVNPHTTIVFQSFALFPWLTVQQNVEIALKARGVPPGLRAARSIALLDSVGLDGFENAYPRELSGGMRQKVGFARAMAVEPELLCLDEPFSALDVLSAEALRGELLELWQTGAIPTKAILMVTHNIEEAVLLAGRIVVMDKGPGRVVAEVPVPLAYPRQRKSAGFLDLVDRVYATLAGETLPEHLELGTAPGEPGLTRGLPRVAINNLTGLLEHLADLPGNEADIYRLAEGLKVESELVLRMTETAELLGFASVKRGDIVLTPLGETFAEAGIQARKEIFASRIRRLPIFRWLLDMLKAADSHSLELDVVQAALELEFHSSEAAHQMESMVDWGRYAELLAYDAPSGTVYLEQGVAA
jgi:NitT/TauT family transport system ATP-binding protein